ncbi:MAG: lysozyme [Pseudomonadota bacterium]
MKASIQAYQLIKNFEGLKLRSYSCPGGYKTIGYGHLVRNNNLDEINETQAEKLLTQDICEAEKSVLRNIQVKLNQNQFDALVSFVFNLGGATLQRSSLKQKINRHEDENICKEWMRFVYSGGIKLQGLVRRRQEELEMFNH